MSIVCLLAVFCTLTGCEKSEAPAKSISKANSGASEKKDVSTNEDRANQETKQAAKGTETDLVKTAPSSDLSDPISLFDGQSLDDWDIIEFGGEGSTYVEEEAITFEMGATLTGISSIREDLPTTDYEVSLDARKIDGVDFFCGLTFPVDESHCTLILGGWGGDLCGLSCIDNEDASSNETSSSMLFKKGQWYKIRVRVEPKKIQAWVDDKQIVNCDIEGREISLRGDTTLCEPLGVCSFQTIAQYKNFDLRLIKSASTPATNSEKMKK